MDVGQLGVKPLSQFSRVGFQRAQEQIVQPAHLRDCPRGIHQRPPLLRPALLRRRRIEQQPDQLHLSRRVGNRVQAVGVDQVGQVGAVGGEPFGVGDLRVQPRQQGLAVAAQV